MNLTTLTLILVTAVFGVFSGHVLLELGYLGLWQSGFANIGTTQITLDLVIVCTLACFWMVSDARKTGRNPWPFVVITLTGGSFGPLLYVLLARLKKIA